MTSRLDPGGLNRNFVLLTDAAEELGISAPALRTKIKRGTAPSARFSGRRFVPREWVEEEKAKRR